MACSFAAVRSILAFALLVTPAAAQVTQKTQGAATSSAVSRAPVVSEVDQSSYKVEFDDDLLGGVPLDGTIPIIKVRIGAASSPLLRPRTSFVRELGKSVEAI